MVQLYGNRNFSSCGCHEVRSQVLDGGVSMQRQYCASAACEHQSLNTEAASVLATLFEVLVGYFPLSFAAETCSQRCTNIGVFRLRRPIGAWIVSLVAHVMKRAVELSSLPSAAGSLHMHMPCTPEVVVTDIRMGMGPAPA